MNLTDYNRLSQIISSIIADHSTHKAELRTSALNLSKSYRQLDFTQAVPSFAQGLSYLAVRLPATYTVICKVLATINDNNIISILDIGSGPGTAIWAALQEWPSIQQVTAYENNAHMLKIAMLIHKQLATYIPIKWQVETLNGQENIGSADIVTISYSLGEMNQANMSALMSQFYSAAIKYIVIIEPGTSHGFAVVRRAREILLKLGGFVIAPCTHDRICPMTQGDWCHFSERVVRTALHRQAKGATLNYEDEKFSYVVVSKQPIVYQDAARIVKKPSQRSGHVRLDLCKNTGLNKKIYSRKDCHLYQRARRVKWGDYWNDNDSNT